MKIFISHSSKDKWAARRISDDLIALGGTTFLDEKDVRTGESIDLSIRNELQNCDDFLLLLSPASLKSEWVLLELGGALALEKTIVPVLLYVGSNELPGAISLKLARDINDVDRYYSEVSDRLAAEVKKVGPGKVTKRKVAKKTAKKKPTRTGKRSGLKVGDTVRVITTRPPDAYRDSQVIDWEDEMDKYLGQTAKIRNDWRDDTFCLDLDAHQHDGGFVYASEWLTKVRSRVSQTKNT